MTTASCRSSLTPVTIIASPATMATDTPAATVRVRPLRSRDTSQPTSAINGTTSATMTSTTHSAGVGFPVMSMSPPPTIE